MLRVLAALLMAQSAHAFHAIQPRLHCSHAFFFRRATLVARAVVPQDIPLDIVYEDADILAINKPSGATVQLAQNAVESAVVFHLNSSSCQWGTKSWPWKDAQSFEGIVHRLDKGTSGLLVIGKHPTAARALQAAFRERHVHKTYLAIGVGMPSRRSAVKLKAMAAANGKSSKSSTVTHVTSVETESVEPRHALLAKAIKGCGRDIDQARALLNDAFAAGEQPSVLCYSTALSVCMKASVKASVKTSVKTSVKDISHEALRGTPRSQRRSSRRAPISDAQGVAARKAAISVLDSMRVRDVKPDVLCFQRVLGLCSREPALWDEAVALINHMESAGLKPTAHCISSAISACGRAGELSAALALLEIESEVDVKEGMADDGSRLRAAIRAAERCGAMATTRVLAARLELVMEPARGGEARTASTDPAARGVALPLGEALVVNSPIGKLCKYTMGLMAVVDGGREARSVVTPIAFDGARSVNRVVIETGRTHQIRVHMASVLGCPLAGDSDYGQTSRRATTPLGTRLGPRSPPVTRPMLHAAELVVPHPITTDAVLRLRCAPPADFMALATAIFDGSAQTPGAGTRHAEAMSDAAVTKAMMSNC